MRTPTIQVLSGVIRPLLGMASSAGAFAQLMLLVHPSRLCWPDKAGGPEPLERIFLTVTSEYDGDRAFKRKQRAHRGARRLGG